MRNNNKSIQKKSSGDEALNQIQTRREFFKSVSKIALPTIAFIGFGSLGRELFGFNNNSFEKLKTPTDCENNCEGTCTADCAGGCAKGCDTTCKSYCTFSCEGACSSECQGKSIGQSTNKSLEESTCDCTGCQGACLGPCTGSCMSSCNNTCGGECTALHKKLDTRTTPTGSVRG